MRSPFPICECHQNVTDFLSVDHFPRNSDRTHYLSQMPFSPADSEDLSLTVISRNSRIKNAITKYDNNQVALNP